MCEKKPYCNREVDECIKDEVNRLNEINFFRTILSCCGHGKYSRTIIVFDRRNGYVFEWYSTIGFGLGIRKPKRYYKKDPQGIYFIPEVHS